MIDLRDELKHALDQPDFPSPALLSQVMAGLDERADRRSPRVAPWIATLVTVALVLTLVVVRTHFSGVSATLPITSTTKGVVGYQFISSRVGWLTVGNLTKTSIFKTVDGGKSWQRQLTIAGSWDFTPTPIHFFDERDGVIGGQGGGVPTVWRTTDGGADWQAHPLPLDRTQELVSVSFLDVQHGWVLTTDAQHAPPQSTATAWVYQTSDGGVRWGQIATLFGPPGTSWMGIDFSTPTSGFVTTKTEGSSLPISTTSDGGRTWSTRELRAPLSGVLTESLIAFAQTAGIMIVSVDRDVPCPGSSPAPPSEGCHGYIPAGRYLYSTGDLGVTWSGPRSIGNGYVALIDPYDWLLLDHSSYSLSSDAGTTWSQPQSLAVPPRWFATQAQFLDANRGWIILSDTSEGNFADSGRAGPGGRNALLFTADGGVSWQPLFLPSA